MMIIRSRSRSLHAAMILCMVLALVLTGCDKQVTLEGKPVKSETIKDAARAVHAADVTAASIVRFLIAGHTAGVIMPAVLETYLKDVGPPLQAALETARDMLVTIAKTPGATTQERVQQVMLEVTKALNKALAFAQKHGWRE